MNFLSILENFREIILSTEKIEFVNEEDVSRLKLKIAFIDSSYLSVREVKARNTFLYSYFWLREDNSIIMGWDNAPHHMKVENFPYHKHIKNEILSSPFMNLEDVLKEIQKILNS